MQEADPFSTPARRRRLVHDIAKGYVFPLVLHAKDTVARWLLCEWAAVVVQAQARGFLAKARAKRARLQVQECAATRIQAHMRRYLAEAEVQLLRTAYRRKLRIVSATRLQMAWRWHVTTRRVAARAAINARLRAIISIQCFVQMSFANRRSRALRLARRRVSAATMIQQAWRVVRDRRKKAKDEQVQQASHRIGNLVLTLVLQRRRMKEQAARVIQRQARKKIQAIKHARELHAFVFGLLSTLVLDPVLATVLASAKLAAERERQRLLEAEQRRGQQQEQAAMEEEERRQREYDQWVVQSLKIEPPVPPPTVFTPAASPITEIKSTMSSNSASDSQVCESFPVEELSAEQALLQQLHEESLLVVLQQRQTEAANLIKGCILRFVNLKKSAIAAVKLQSNWRMILAKRTLNKLLMDRRCVASVAMQRVVRGHLARKKFSHLVQQQIAQHFQAIYMYAQAQIPPLIPSLSVEHPSEAQFEAGPMWAKLYSVLPLPPAPPGCVPKHISDVPDNYRLSLDDPNIPSFLKDLRAQNDC